MGAAEVEAFLIWLANHRGVSASTHRQALAALIFLYKQVLEVDLPWLQEIGRPRAPQAPAGGGLIVVREGKGTKTESPCCRACWCRILSGSSPAPDTVDE